MKKTLFITMLAAALMGGQVFADYIPTTTDAPEVDDGFYVGEYSQTADVSRANVTINEEEEGGDDFSNSGVYGGFTVGEQTSAINNSVTMTGGQVYKVEGAYSVSGSANDNSVMMSGGIVAYYVYSGYTGNGNANGNTIEMTGGVAAGVQCGTARVGNANDNVVIFSGGTLEEIDGGVSFDQGEASGNRVVMSDGTVTGYVFSGYAANGNANGNTIEMTGGVAAGVECGETDDGNANDNVVVVSGGTTEEIYGGVSHNQGEASGNKVYITGTSGEKKTDVYGAYFEGSSTGNDNAVHLVGAGADITIDGENYIGHALQLGSVYAATGSTGTGNSTGNSIEIYGTGIAAATLSSMQMLNFHIADGVLLSQEAMVSLTSTSDGEGLDLTGVEIGFSAADVQDWGKYEGQSITLVTAAQAITIDAGSLGEVAIKDANGSTVATATLALGGSDDVLSLSNIKGATPVPEPGTGVLGLLALGLLAGRRRKH